MDYIKTLIITMGETNFALAVGLTLIGVVCIFLIGWQTLTFAFLGFGIAGLLLGAWQVKRM